MSIYPFAKRQDLCKDGNGTENLLLSIYKYYIKIWNPSLSQLYILSWILVSKSKMKRSCFYFRFIVWYIKSLQRIDFYYVYVGKFYNTNS